MSGSRLASHIKMGSATSTRIECCIFDMDGLLLDTEKFYTEVHQEIAQQHGKQFTWELKTKQMGKKALEASRLFVAELGLEAVLTGEAVLEQREARLDQLFPTAQLLPGAERLLRHLHSHGIPFALATSSNKRHYEMKTAQHKELFSLFSAKLTGDDVTRGKPAPDIFEKAAALVDATLPAEKCLVFEDAPSGVQAGRAANMYVVMVPDPNLDPAQHEGAHQVLASLNDFDPASWGLPPYDD